MKKKLKRLLGIFLCLCMVLSVLPRTAFATESTTCESHDFDENYFCAQCGKSYVASLNGTFYESLDEAWLAANALTNDGRIDADAQLVLHADATLIYDSTIWRGTLWEGTTFTIEEGVTLTTDHLTIRDELINHGTIRALDGAADQHLSVNYNNHSFYGTLDGEGEYDIAIYGNGGAIYNGIFYKNVTYVSEINAGTFFGDVTLRFQDSIIYGGTFQDIILEGGILDYDPTYVTINGVVYDSFSSGNTKILINGAPHTHLPGEVTYENTSQDKHSVLTACLTCPFELYMFELEGHTYTDGHCICGKPEGYNLYVDGIEANADNYADILGDGTASYDAESNTLTLNNANIVDSGALPGDSTATVGIYTEKMLNLVLIGENFVSSAASPDVSVAVYAMQGLTITGSGTLTAECGDGALSYAIITQNLTLAEESSVTANGFVLALTLNALGDFNAIVNTNTGPYCYEVYGDAVLSRDLTIDGNNDSSETYAYITILEGAKLTIADGVTLTIADNTNLTGSAQNLITNNSEVVLQGTAKLVNNGVGVCTETAKHCFGPDFSCLICGYKGEATLDENLHFAMNITAGAEMRVKYHIIETCVSRYENFYLEVRKDTAGGEPVVTTYGFGGDHIPFGDLAGYFYYADYTGVAAKEMGDNFSTTLYAMDADGNIFYSNTVTASIKDFLLGRFNEDNATVETKTMAIDMLKYGAAAQVRFDYGTDALVTADLSEEQLAYATEGIPEAMDCYVESGEGANILTNVTVGSRVELGLSVTLESVTEGSAVRCEIRDADGNLIAEPEVSSAAECVFVASYSDVGAREMRKPIYITFYDGENAVSKTVTWNVETYVARERSADNATQEQINVVNAMLIYGDSVGAYLTSIGE